MRVPVAGEQVAIKGPDRLRADRDDPHPAALAEDPEDGLVQVDVITVRRIRSPAKPGHFSPASPGVDEYAKTRGVPARQDVAAALDARQEFPQLVLAKDRHGLIDDLRWAHLGHRARLDLALFGQPREEALDPAIAVRR